MTRLAFLATILTLPAHASSCRAPDVPRVVETGRPVIACPETGNCRWVAGETFRVDLECLTPADHAAALERGR